MRITLTMFGILAIAMLVAGCGTASDEPLSGDSTVDAQSVDSSALSVSPANPCDADEDCDDKLSCTTDTCSEQGLCQWQLAADSCLIGNVCYSQGDSSTAQACRVCDANQTPNEWSIAPGETACDDGTKCSLEGQCDDAGDCQTQPIPCNDNNPCTTDSCTPGIGCVYPPTGVTECDDANPCTSDDGCTDGQCVGTAFECDDANPCTTDSCDPALGCTETNNTEPCDDGDACTADDACAEGACTSQGPTNCDDGNACTIDSCNKLAGCSHLPTQNACCTGQTSICDDGNPCTTDLCDPKTSACSQKINAALCDDGDACTSKDICGGGSCSGQPTSCDDKNLCTLDACDKSKGCVYAPTNEGKSCDDGNPCSKSDTCGGGVCKGTGACACTPKFSKVSAKVSDLKIGKGGQPGEGLDLDGDPKTCAPSTSCTGGIDNSLGALAAIINTQLDAPVAEGTIMLLVEFIGFKQGSVNVAIHQGALDEVNKTCDFQKAVCKYTADTTLLDPKTCAPKAALKGNLAGTKLTAGGKGTTFPFSLPLQDGVFLDLTLYNLQLVGTVKTKNGAIESMSALLGGAVLTKDLQKAIDALPAEGLPIPKATIKTLLNSTVETDVDIDGDGKPEASSIALKLAAIPAIITGAK